MRNSNTNQPYISIFQGVKTSAFVPYTIVGTLMIISGLLVLQLPETHKQVLTDRLVSAKARENNDEHQKMVNVDPVLESSV